MRLAAGFAALAVGLAVGAPVARAAEVPPPAPTTTTTPPLAPYRPNPTVMRNASAALRAAKTAYSAAQAQLTAAERRATGAEHDLTAAKEAVVLAEARQKAVRAQLRRAEIAHEAAVEEFETARRRLSDIAIGSYISGGDGSASLNLLLESTDIGELVRRQALLTSAADAQERAAREYRAAKDKASGRVEALQRELGEVTGARADSERAVGDAESALARARAGVEEARVASTARGTDLMNAQLLANLVSAAAPVGDTDIPRMALDAYQRAALMMRAKAPDCRVRWTAIAALGRIESDHGRIHDGQLSADGRIHPPIVGIPLDGTRGTRAIADTDGGLHDGDTVWDRAVGPMQFIPSTWKFSGLDGNGDGFADPNNIYDATLSAAAYLCRAAPDAGLADPQGLSVAFFSYNHADWYVQRALGVAATYDAAAPAIGSVVPIGVLVTPRR